MSANEFLLCDSIVIWPWVVFFWFWNGVLLLLTVHIVCSLTLRYFEKALSGNVSIILVILSMKIDFADIKWKLLKV